jgi:hypothetical protein
VAELEANLPTIAEQHMRKALRMWINLYSMPKTHPLAPLIRHRRYKRFASPIQRITESTHSAPVEELGAIRPYVSALWDARLDIVNSIDDGVQAAAQAQETLGIRVATSASARNQLVGIGGAIEGINWMSNDNERCEYDRSVGTSTWIDAYTAALASIKVRLGMVVDAMYAGAISPSAYGQTIHAFTNNRIVLITLRAPSMKSGQAL